MSTEWYLQPTFFLKTKIMKEEPNFGPKQFWPSHFTTLAPSQLRPKPTLAQTNFGRTLVVEVFGGGREGEWEGGRERGRERRRQGGGDISPSFFVILWLPISLFCFFLWVSSLGIVAV